MSSRARRGKTIGMGIATGVAMLFGAVIVLLHAKPANPRVFGAFCSPPTFRLCDTAPISESSVRERLDWLEDQGSPGYRLLVGHCDGLEPPRGEIWIDLRGQAFSEDHAGHTWIDVEPSTGEISRGLCEAPEGLDRGDVRTWTHEFAHAYGLDHWPETGDMMHPCSPRPGSDGSGPDRDCTGGGFEPRSIRAAFTKQRAMCSE